MKRQSLFSGPFLMVIGVSLCDSMSHMMLQFMISSYAVDIGIAATLAAALVSIISVASLLMRPVAGWLVDALNQKRLLVFAMAASCVAMLLYYFAADFWSLLLARLVHGLSYGLSAVAAVTIAGALVPRERIGSGIAIYGMGNTVSVIFATKIAQLIIRAGGASWMFAACLIFSGCGLLLAALLPASPKRPKQAGRRSLRELLESLYTRQALPFAGLSMLFSLSQAINSAFLVIYFRESAACGRYIGDSGITMMIWGVAIFACRPLVGKLYDRFGLVPAAVACMGCGALYMVVLGITPNVYVTYLATFFFGGMCGCSSSVLQAAAYAAAPRERKGAANSTNLMGGDIGSSLGGVVFGWTVTAFASNSLPTRGYQISYLLCTIPLLIAIAFCLIMRKSRLLRPLPATELV